MSCNLHKISFICQINIKVRAVVPLGILGVVDHFGLVCLLATLEHSIRIRLPDHVGLDQILGLDQVNMKNSKLVGNAWITGKTAGFAARPPGLVLVAGVCRDRLDTDIIAVGLKICCQQDLSRFNP